MTVLTFIAELGAERAKHLFGGQAWTMIAPGASAPLPATILTLDPSDQRLDLDWPGDQLPLASRLDAGIPEQQSYIVDHSARALNFEGPPWLATGSTVSTLPNPLPERSLRLRSLRPEEDLATASSKYEVQDTFLGDTQSGFLRVGGEPLWLYQPQTLVCTCGKQMQFVACVGYENYSQPSGMISPRVAFFLGELALYFFACAACSRVVAITQST